MNAPRRYSLWLLLALACIVSLGDIIAQAQYELRIGVIDYPAGSMLAGARLAADHINSAGGLTGADGTRFELAVVDTTPDNMEIAIANMKQASVFAVIGPQNDALARRHLSQLQTIQAPVFIPATGDTILLSDHTGRIFRSRAAEHVLINGLADYLATTLAIQSINTIQLDAASTASLISFANALADFGLRPSNLVFDQSRLNLQEIAEAVAVSAPEAVAIFGPPRLAAQALVQIRDFGYAGERVYSQAREPSFAERLPPDLLPGIISYSTWSASLEDSASQHFTLAYARAFGRLPDALAAASYDALRLIAAATAQGGSVFAALAATSSFAGVQGELNPAGLLPGETSNNAVVTRLNEYGAANVIARYPHTIDPATEPDKVPTVAPTAAALAPSATPTGYRLKITRDFLNVRSGPGTDYEIIGQVIEGSQARILGANADHSWVIIDYRGQWGWVAAYLAETYGDRNFVPIIEPPATPTPAPTDTPSPPTEPDLIVLKAQPARLAIGQATAVDVTILNQGLSPAGSFAVAGSFQPGGQYAGVNLAGLNAGQQANLQLRPLLSGPTGPQSVVIVADLNQEVYEGDAGESNNRAFVYNYMADRPVLVSGTWTTSAGSIDLDGDASPDLSWTGNALAALGQAAFAAVDQYSALSQTHFDAISGAPANTTIVDASQLAAKVYALVTADGHRGAMQVTDVTRNGPITIEYRIYR